jgi:membrane protein DedA with SNARE-associated domain
MSAGIIEYPFRRFMVFAGLGAALWAVYGVALAYLGRTAFPGNMWASTALAVALVFALSGLLHLWNVRRNRNRGDDQAASEKSTAHTLKT